MEPATYRLTDVIDLSLDADAHIARIPGAATTKGYFVNAYYEYVSDHDAFSGEAFTAMYPQRFPAFKDVPIREQAQRMVDVAALVHPTVPLSQGLRLVGRSVYGNALRSLVGRTVLRALGDGLQFAARQGPQAFTAFERHGSVVTYRPLGTRGFAYDYALGLPFLGCYHVGILEGAAIAFSQEPRVTVRLASETRGTLELEW